MTKYDQNNQNTFVSIFSGSSWSHKFNVSNREDQGSIFLLRVEQGRVKDNFSSRVQNPRDHEPNKSVKVFLIDLLIFGCCCSCLCPKITFDFCYVFSRKVSFAQKVLEKGGPKVFGKRSMNQFVSV